MRKIRPLLHHFTITNLKARIPFHVEPTHYTQVIKLKPNDAQAYYDRGLDYSHKGELDNAISQLEKKTAAYLITDLERRTLQPESP